MTDMAGYRRQNADGPNSEEKALDLFAEMMIEKIESINEDWRKPWFTEGALQWPRNLSGREYNGMNAFMLMLHCEKEGYKIPRFCTFDCVQRMNKPGKDGQELPEGLRAARREILPGDAHHFHLHTQGDEGENQV